MLRGAFAIDAAAGKTPVLQFLSRLESYGI
jgi:hypothetical protein